MDTNAVYESDVGSVCQSVSNVCDDTVTPSRRRSRRSWFETPPATKLEIIHEKKKRRSSGAGKRKSVENMETLLLTHFTNPPKVYFGKIKIGKSRIRHLLVKNPHDYEQDVIIEKFPHKRKFEIESKTFTVPPEDCLILTITWTPEEDGNFREMVLFKIDGCYRLQAFLLGCAELPKQLKKGKKGILGAKIKRPFSILQTPGLACIRDNYSPLDSEKPPFVRGKFRELCQNTDAQRKHSENEDGAFPPPTLESTAIAKDPTSSVCRSDLYNKMADLGCSPALLPVSQFSPIPNAENEYSRLVDSCCSVMQTSPLREITVNRVNSSAQVNTARLEARGPDKFLTVFDRKESAQVGETATQINKTKPVESEKECVTPQSFLNDSLCLQGLVEKKDKLKKSRPSWTPHRISPFKVLDQEESEKKFLSPDSFLNDSLIARMSGIGATPGRPFPDTAPAFDHEEFESSIVSPNSFLEELNSTRNDSLGGLQCLPSSAVPRGPIPSRLVKKFQNSLAGRGGQSNRVGPRAATVTKSSNRGHSSQTNQSRLTAPTIASTRRATAAAQKPEQATDRFSSVPAIPSPRRATFLVSKKNQYGAKKLSPKSQKSNVSQKKMVRTQRYVNIHQADVIGQATEAGSRSNGRKSSERSNTPTKKAKTTKTQEFITSAMQTGDASGICGQEWKRGAGYTVSSATVTKKKPEVLDDERRESGSRKPSDTAEDATLGNGCSEDGVDEWKVSGTRGEPVIPDPSATVTKDRPLLQQTDMERSSGRGKSFFKDLDDMSAIAADVPADDASATIGKEQTREVTVERRRSGKRLFADVSQIGESLDSTDSKKEQQVLSEIEKISFGSPSKMMNDVFVGNFHVGRMSLTVTKGVPSFSTFTKTPSDLSQSRSMLSVDSIKSNNRSRRFSGKSLFGAEPMSPSKSPILSSIFRDIGSPSRIPTSPDVEVTRRITLTVTKSRPSDALMESTLTAHVTSKQDSEPEDDYLVEAREETFVKVTGSREGFRKRKHVLGADTTAAYNFTKVDTYAKTVSSAQMKSLEEQTRSWEVSSSPAKTGSSSYTLLSPVFAVTPHPIPTSPTEEHSRRSTHILTNPKVLTPAGTPRRLFPPLSTGESGSLRTDREESRASESVYMENVPVVEEEKLGKVEQQESIISTISTDSMFSSDSLDAAKSSADSYHLTMASIEKSSLTADDSVFEKGQDTENIPPESESVFDPVCSESPLKPGVEVEREHVVLLRSGGVDKEAKDNQRRKVKAARVSPLPVKPDRRSGELAVGVAERDRCMKTVAGRGSRAGANLPGNNPTFNRRGNPALKKRSLAEDKENVEKESLKKRSKSLAAESNTAPKKQGFLSRLTSTGKKSKVAVKGLAQSKLILVKNIKHGMPKHPMPFAAKNMYYDERWVEKQDRGFVHWLNFVLTPPDEYSHTVSKTRVDAGAVSVDRAATAVRLAPSKEVLSVRAYTARRRLNRLRRAACQLYQSHALAAVILRLEHEVERKRISVRKDRMLHADIGIKQKILDMLLCYNPLWLRVGLETVFGEVLPLQSNSDVFGLSHYILARFLDNPDIAEEYSHPTVPHLYREGYADAIAKHALKKFLLLVYFLDQAKSARLIQHDPCLFCKDADIKASKDLLIQFSRDYLSGEGDVTKHLAYLGYTVMHAQTALDEFDYAVTRLSVDLRDGFRLTRVLELLTGQWKLVQHLRAPAISRLQKVHNIEMVFKALEVRGLDVVKAEDGKLSARDIVDGHREKTLKLLWHLIFHFQVDVLVNMEQLRGEIRLLEQSLRVKVNMQRLLQIKQQENHARRDSGDMTSGDNERTQLLMMWCRTVCLHYGVKVENFTVSFSDGRALCCLLHHYHPALLPLSQIHLRTSQSLQQDLEDRDEQCRDLDLSQDWDLQHGTDFDDPELFEELLSNERENFKTLYEKVSELGGIPLMLRVADMSNTIPDEKVVMTYVSYLCGRLLDIREESRAARVVQIAWRRYRLRTALRAQTHEIVAARVIQTRVRAFLQKRRLQRQSRAVLVLQSAWRGRMSRVRARLLRQARDDTRLTGSVITLQAAVRGVCARRRYLRLQNATLTLQSHARGYLVRKRLCRQQEAAKNIQAWYRGCHLAHQLRTEFCLKKSACVVVQRKLREVLARRRASRSRAAIVVQQVWRGYRCRTRLDDVRKSVCVLQKYVRMRRARKAYLALKDAVLKLQARVRGNKLAGRTRQEFLLKKGVAIRLQARYRAGVDRKRVCAAVCIQKNFRGHKYRVKFLAMQLATIMIQRAYRHHLVDVAKRKAVRQKTTACVALQRWWRLQRQERCLRRDAAAVVIQSAFRCHADRRQYNNTRSAVVTIQTFVRLVQARRRFCRQRAAAVVIQQHYREYCVAREARCQYQLMVSAAVIIQASWRGRRVRKYYVSMLRSAVQIQSWVRQIRAARRFRNLKAACVVVQRRYKAVRTGRDARRSFLKMKSAAVTLQSVHRQRVCRRVFIRAKQAAVVIQKYARGRQQRARYLELRQVARIEKAVVSLQSVWRGRRERMRYTELRGACVSIQRRYRGVRAARRQRKEYLEVRRACVVLQSAIRRVLVRRIARKEEAATVIQRRYRGHLVRSEFLLQKTAAVKLQSLFRMWREQQMYRRLQQAVVLVQRRYRSRKLARKSRRAFLIKKGATITVQACWRGYLVRRHLKLVHRSAAVIQAGYRGHRQRTLYTRLHSTVLAMQRLHRKNCEAVIQRRTFLKEKHASIVIQKYVRKSLARSKFLKNKTAAVVIQRAFRCRRERASFLLTRKATVVCQTRLRATILARKQRAEYMEMRRSALALQSTWRGVVARRQVQQVRNIIMLQATIRRYLARQIFNGTIRSVVRIQARVRGHLQRRDYLRTRQAVCTIQRRWRATRMSRSQRTSYLIQVGAAITLQQWFRSRRVRKEFLATRGRVCRVQACVRGYQQRRRYRHVVAAVRTIQGWYRCLTEARRERARFLQMTSSVCVLQAGFRRWRERRRRVRDTAAATIQSVFRMRAARTVYCQTRRKVVVVQAVVRRYLARCEFCHRLIAISVLQRNIRTFLLHRRLRQAVYRRRQAALLIQRAYRRFRCVLDERRQEAATVIQAAFRMSCERRRFQRVCRAAVTIQSHVRGTRVRQLYRELIRRQRAALCLQRCYRGYKTRIHLQRLQAERREQLVVYARNIQLHLAAVKIQRWYRQRIAIRHARQRVHSVILIQRRVRVFLERVHYLRLRHSAVLLQRRCRQWLATRHGAATVLQRAVRRWLVRCRRGRLHSQVARIQALWRGYQARKKATCGKIRRARTRCLEASRNATDAGRLGNRTTSALDYLLQYKSLAQILEALVHLDVATRLSPRCCERLVEVHAVHVIYRLIRSCNRSLPHMELIKYCVNILLNLAKYKQTVNAVHDVESTEILVDLMQIYREKGGAIFTKTCCLLGILALDPHRRRDIVGQGKLVERIRSIHSLVLRRQKVDDRQNVVRAKLAAMRSFNSTLPLPTPVKRRRIRPEWSMRRDSLDALHEPMSAINFVMENLHLTAK